MSPTGLFAGCITWINLVDSPSPLREAQARREPPSKPMQCCDMWNTAVVRRREVRVTRRPFSIECLVVEVPHRRIQLPAPVLPDKE